MSNDRRTIIQQVRARELLEQRKRESDPLHKYCPHTPTDKQREFLNLPCREALYGGAAGGGKSDAVLMAALQYVHLAGYSAIIFRRTFADLSKPGALMDRAAQWLQGTDATWNNTLKQWTFPSGATLVFGYLDTARDRYNYAGSEYQFIGFDELTQIEQQDYLFLFSRLRKLRGVDIPLRVRAASNPGDMGHEWVKSRFIIHPDDRTFIPATLEDNPHIDQQSYDEALSQLDAITYAQLRKGIWERDAGACVYRLQEDNGCDELPPNHEWHYVLGLDFGYRDHTAFALLAYALDHDCVYVVRSESWEKLTPSDCAKKIVEWRAAYGEPSKMVGDVGGLGKAYAEEARQRFGLPIEPAEKVNKLGYVRLLNGDLENKRLWIVRKDNAALWDQMSKLLWRNEKHDAEHPSMRNDLCDAVLYAWRACKHWAYHEPEKPRDESPEDRMRAHHDELLKRNDQEKNNQYSYIIARDEDFFG